MTAIDRVIEKIDFSGRCWLWRGWINNMGYAGFNDAGRKWYVHRWMYHRTYGPIPPGLELDHLCSTRNCVRPTHLEAVTHGENISRGMAPVMFALKQSLLTHCKYGHPFDDKNTIVVPNSRPAPHRLATWRKCRICRNRMQREWRHGRKAS